MKQTWMGIGGALLLASMFVGCPPDGGNGGQDGGSDANDIIIEEPIIKVSGTAAVHPAAAAYLQSIGVQVPSLEGVTLRVEDPLLASLDDPNGFFGAVTLDASGAFAVENVDTAHVSVGIAAGIRDERDAGTAVFARTATTLWDSVHKAGDPEADISGAKAYAVPTEFVDKLTAAITPVAIQMLSAVTPKTSTLQEAGFILGRVVDAQGNPVAGAKIVATEHGDRYFYPSEDYASANQTATSANGLFVFVWSGEEAADSLHNFEIEGKPEYGKRQGGAATGAGVIVTVYPGDTAP